MENFFKLKERGTTVRAEITAGLTTFFAMVYILMVNANMFSDPFGDGSNPLGVSFGAVYIATAISAIIGTVLMGLLANLPLALCTGMGLNAFFVYTVCIEIGLSYANALVLIFFEGLVFVVLTLTGLRKKMFDAIPKPVRDATTAGIGLFIAFIGLQSSGIIVPSSSTAVTLGSFNILKGNWSSMMPAVVTIIAFLALIIMSKRNVKGSVLIAIIGGTALYYILGLTIPNFYNDMNVNVGSPLDAFSQFVNESFGKVFTEGFDFSTFIEQNGVANLIITIITTALAFCMVDMFDTMATLYGAVSQGDILTEDGQIPNMEKAMLSDAVATMSGAVCGTSTVTTVAESASGIVGGGRTGLAAIVSAFMILIAMFLSPVAQLIPNCATAPALIYVGVLMISSIKGIDWKSVDIAAPAFMTFVMMPLSYNISYGIAFGIITYVIVNLFTGKAKEVKISTWIIALLFVAMLVLTH